MPYQLPDTRLRVILPARLIPVNSTVTKRTGEKEYLLREKITIYDDTDPSPNYRRDIVSEKGKRFLVNPDNGDVNVITGGTDLCWLASREAVTDWIAANPTEC